MTRSDTTQRLGVGKLPSAFLAKLLASTATDDPSVLIGPGVGRDAAAIALGDRVLVAKTDPITFATRDAAAYLVDVNANDLACLGATPRWLLVTTLFPDGVAAEEVEAQFRSVRDVCAERGIALVGGHTEITTSVQRTVLVGLMLGESTPERLLRPGGAHPGDRLLLAGAVAVEGTALLARELPDALEPLIGPDLLRSAQRLIERPGLSVVPAAKALLAAGGVAALHDPTEGGLSTGVRELATAAGCGARIERARAPVLPETRAIADALGLDPLGMLASGALLVAAKPEAVGRLRDAARAARVDLTEIGEVRPAAEGFVLVDGGADVPLPEWSTDEAGRALAEHAASADGPLGGLRPMSARLVGSANAAVGFPAGMAVLRAGGSALDAVVAAISAVEAHPDDHSVGCGGLPNLLGEVELDASVMDGRDLRAGAIGALRGHGDAIALAHRVMEDLPHVMLAGEGAARFAREAGFPAGHLLTPEAEAIWRARLDEGRSREDAYHVRMDELAGALSRDPERPHESHGTVNVIARDRAGNLACGVSTSDWAWKYPGRLGDSPIIGAGNYADNRHGAAACTGRGEMALRLCTAHGVVMAMRFGRSLDEALTLAALDLHALADPYWSEVNIVAVDREGRPAAVSTAPGKTFVVQDEAMAEPEERERRFVPSPPSAHAEDA